MRQRRDVFTYVLNNIDTRGRCWLWQGTVNKHGYGRIEVEDDRKEYVHRLMYEWSFGPIPEGKTLMHSCDTPSCVKPSHLRPGTQAENNADRHRKGRSRNGCAHRGKTHCIRDHELTLENTYVNKLGHRYCRACHREYERARQWRKVAG